MTGRRRADPASPRHRRALVGTALLLVATGCGIQTDSAPRDLPEEERPITNISTASGATAFGADRVYLVGPGEERLLRSVPRETEPGTGLLDLLLLGPNQQEAAAQYTTVIPPGTQVLSSRPTGSVLLIDLSEEITELTPESLTVALAQIVYTATEIDGIDAVQIEVENEPVTWPKARGTTEGRLSIYDYPGFVQTAQPAYPAVPVAG